MLWLGMNMGWNLFFRYVGAISTILAITGPPAWWYWHHQRPGERRKRQWAALLAGIALLIVPLRAGPLGHGDWLGSTVVIAQWFGAPWLIAWGARGLRVA